MIEALKHIDPSVIVRSVARKKFINYVKYTKSDYEFTGFHKTYCEILDRFAKGKIKKLIVSAPPQHGKSELSSRRLPTFMHGLNPDLKAAILSFESGVAQDFNTDCQRIIESEEYQELFPNTCISSTTNEKKSGYKKNTKVYEVVGHKGSLRAVGRNGSLTSKTLDLAIIDDMYKNQAEGNSPTIREASWKVYVDVVRTRLHNDSQELIVFTRWNGDDIIGRIEEAEQVIEVKKLSDLDNIPEGAWVKINYQAIKEGEPTEIDPREEGQPLWPDRHSKMKLVSQRNLDEHEFSCLYQGEPEDDSGKLYGEFKTYKDISDYGITIGKGNYTDTADTGDDKLASFSYDLVKGKDCNYALITDVVYTDEPIEETMVSVPMMLKRSSTRYASIESNNGGRAFALSVKKAVKMCAVKWFHQSGNKESRILTNAGLVMTHIVFPHDWKTRWNDLYKDLKGYKRIFASNKHDDAADVLTGIIETDLTKSSKKKGVKRRN